MVRNKARLRKVGDYIASHPSEYNQESWAEVNCKTTCCIAGATVQILAGFRGFDISGYSEDEIKRAKARKYSLGVDYVMFKEQGEPVQSIDIPILARQSLGLTPDEATTLFSPDWKPAGWEFGMGQRKLANLVKKALYGLAEGKSIENVSAW